MQQGKPRGRPPRRLRSPTRNVDKTLKGLGTRIPSAAVEASPTPLPRVNFALLVRAMGETKSAKARARPASSVSVSPPAYVARPSSAPPASHDVYEAEDFGLVLDVSDSHEPTQEPAYRSSPPPAVRKRRRPLLPFALLWVSVACVSFYLSAEYRPTRPAPQDAPSGPPSGLLAMNVVEPASTNVGVAFGPIARAARSDIPAASAESLSRALSEAPQVSQKRARHARHKRAKHGAHLKRHKHHKSMRPAARWARPSS